MQMRAQAIEKISIRQWRTIIGELINRLTAQEINRFKDLTSLLKQILKLAGKVALGAW
jgi:hypothetical protein